MAPTRAVAAAIELRVLDAFMSFLLIQCRKAQRVGQMTGLSNRLRTTLEATTVDVRR
jgi:hypothetical protein